MLQHTLHNAIFDLNSTEDTTEIVESNLRDAMGIQDHGSFFNFQNQQPMPYGW